MNPGTFARTTNRRPARVLRHGRVLGLGATVLGAAALGLFSLLPSAGPVAASETGEDPPGRPGAAIDEVVPDVVVGLPPVTAPADDPTRLADDLRAVRGVSWVASDPMEGVMPRLLVGFEADAGDDPLGAVEAAVARQPGDDELPLVGRAITEREIDSRIGRGTFAALVLAALAGAAVVTLLAGWARGLMAGVTVAVSGALGTAVGSTAAGAFDGSVATTAVPGALAAVVVSGCLVVRLVCWFEHPQGEDQGEMIRRAVSCLATELVLFFAGLAVVALFLEWFDPARSAATPMLVGALIAAVLTLAVVPLTLAGLHGLDPPLGMDGNSTVPSTQRLLPFNLPTGQDFPVIALLVFAALLVCLSLFGFQSTSSLQAIDERLTSNDGPSATLAEELASTGDPTNGILAQFPGTASAEDKVAWLERVSQLTSVAYLDTPVGRYELGELVSPAEGATGGAGDPSYAVIVLQVAGRSGPAQDLVAAIEATNAPVGATLSGVPVDAVLSAERDGQTAWATLLSLAAVAAVAVFTLVGDLVLAALAAGLRLLGSAAVLGVHHLLVSDVSGAELQIVLVALAMGVGLFEIAYLQRLLVDHQTHDADQLIDRALVTDGRPAMVGLTLAATAALGLTVTDLAVVRRLGIVLVVGVVLELVVGIWLLRPAVEGTRIMNYFASQPVRNALRVLAGGDSADAGHQQWVGVVDYLLHAEFHHQVGGGDVDLSSVYVSGTPVHQQATAHQESLLKAGLRVVGRSPQLRSVRVVSSRKPVTVAVTVDHPVRQLVAPDGSIVGVRKPERRSVMLWLAGQHDGTYRIADVVDLGVMALAVNTEDVPEAPGQVLGTTGPLPS